MNKAHLSLLLIASMSPVIALAGNHHLGKGVYSPAKGIVCDKSAGFCADSEGISLTYTKEYLGNNALNALQNEISETERAGSSFDMNEFILSNNAHCKISQQKCVIQNTNNIDLATTSALFGTNEAEEILAESVGAIIGAAATSAQGSSHELGNGVYSPSKGIVCDRNGGICADSYGISLAYTKEYLGDSAEKALQTNITDTERAGSKFDMTEFTFSNMAHCKVSNKTCVVKYTNDKDVKTSAALFGK